MAGYLVVDICFKTLEVNENTLAGWAQIKKKDVYTFLFISIILLTNSIFVALRTSNQYEYCAQTLHLTNMQLTSETFIKSEALVFRILYWQLR